MTWTSTLVPPAVTASGDGHAVIWVGGLGETGEGGLIGAGASGIGETQRVEGKVGKN